MDLLALLQAGDVERFNASRGHNARLEFFAEELAGVKLVGVDLQAVVLDKSDLTESDLTEANLVRASLADIDGSEMVLDGVLGMKARLRDAWLERADLTGADFSRGDLSGACLVETKGEGLRLLGARLKEAEARKASWPLADLTEASAKGADFRDADLSRTKWTEASAGGADFRGARLDGADAAGLKLGGANLAGASLVGARLGGAHLTDADLSGADLSHADLTRANLTNCKLVGAKLTGTVFIDATLDGADLTDADLAEADLTGVDPGSIGLTEAQVEDLAGYGARFDPDAPLVFDDAVTAHGHGAAATVWINPDSAEAPTVRWALADADGLRTTGVLPVSCAAVAAHGVVANTVGFVLYALVDRADGIVLQTWRLTPDGALARPLTAPLGFEPAVRPIVRGAGEGFLAWFLARRGPTLIVLEDVGDGEGPRPRFTEAKSTARGFLGADQPVMLAKGGVVQAVTPDGFGPPRRTPDGFPARVSAAAPAGDRLLAVWATAAAVRDPGGLRFQWLESRAGREIEVLSENPDVHGLDAVTRGGTTWVTWSDGVGEVGARVWVAKGDPFEVDEVRLEGTVADAVRFAATLDDGPPVLAVSCLTGDHWVVDLEGRVLARFADPSDSPGA